MSLRFWLDQMRSSGTTKTETRRHPARRLPASSGPRRGLSSNARELNHADPPAWFVDALNSQAEDSDVCVDGCAVHLRSWGDSQHPLLVSADGGAAHSGWWNHAIRHRMAPWLHRATTSGRP